MLNIILLLLGGIVVFGEISMIGAWVIARLKYKKEKNSSYTPETCVIVPCKGTDKHFMENMKAIYNQEYKNYKVIFVTDSKKDPAYLKLKDFFGNKPKVEVGISDFIEGCSGKISALIKGIKIAGDVEAYVFADSDIKPHKDWLRLLVSNLDEDGVGATTGYRWFFPCDFKTSLLSCWNMAGGASLFFSSVNFAWGGSTAIKKSVFEKLDIESKWKTGFSDDLILTNTIKKAGYKIKFVPKCIVESPSEESIRSFIRWGTRQLTWVRWYYPLIWTPSVIGITGMKVATCLGFILLIFGFTIPGLLMISTIFFEIICGWQAHLTVKKIMYYPKKRFGSSFSYAMLMPVVFFILAYNNLGSCFKREIKWGGRSYRKSDVIRK